MKKAMALLILHEQQSQIDKELNYGIEPDIEEQERILVGFISKHEHEIAKLSDTDAEKLNDMYIEYLEGLLNEA